MNDGVKLLLERMDSHPEEFWPLYTEDPTPSTSTRPHFGMTECRFFHLMDNFLSHSGVGYRYLDDEDFDALKNRINKFKQAEFTEVIFSQIVGGSDLELKKHLGHLRNTPSATQTLGLSMGQLQAQQAVLSHQILHQQALAAQQSQGRLVNGGGDGVWNSMRGFFGGSGGTP